ncbi:HNH endonuclease [Spiroplasma endosymbiont of Anurida maritima]|uniref:HNH endonuclease n=1 Tax=Spiroplasma endosymbiont of Anurida maritima TaxID=2967972 RepID=UPI0036D2C757
MDLTNKQIAVWNNAEDCECLDTKENLSSNHKLCGICEMIMYYGSHESVEIQNNSGGAWNIDHIKPLSKGGNNDISNLQAVHIDCNIFKADS